MNITKKIVTGLIAISLILMTSYSVWAQDIKNVSEKEYKIGSKGQLMRQLKSKTEKPEDVFKNTSPMAIKEYNEYLKEEVINAMSQLSQKSEMEFDITKPETVSKSSKVELEDGTIVELTETVGAANPLLAKMNATLNYIGSVASSYNFGAIVGTHSYGERYYQCKYKIRFTAYPDTVCSLYTYFDASKSRGFTATGTSTAGSSTWFPVSLAKSSKITDSTARTVGTDINGQGDYTATLAGYNGVGAASWEVTMRSTIKLNALYNTTYKSTASNTVYR